jgi:hypothetical protein
LPGWSLVVAETFVYAVVPVRSVHRVHTQLEEGDSTDPTLLQEETQIRMADAWRVPQVGPTRTTQEATLLGLQGSTKSGSQGPSGLCRKPTRTRLRQKILGNRKTTTQFAGPCSKTNVKTAEGDTGKDPSKQGPS